MTLVHDWEDDKTNGIKIIASRMMAQQDDIRDELTNSIDKDGQTVWTGDMDGGDRKITNYGQTSVPNARDDVPFLGQLQDQTGVYVAASGTDAIGISPVPALDALDDGNTCVIKAAADNTGAVTLNVSGLGAKSVTKAGSTALDSGDLKAGGIYALTFNSANDQWEVMNSSFGGGGVSLLTVYYLATS
jgi:hypothetical protein